MATFTYHIRSGRLEHPEVGVLAVGYSGRGAGLNNPDRRDLHGVEGAADAGPIPPGKYTWSETEDSHGGFAIVLVPDPTNIMYGRGGFLIHGDMKGGPPCSASLGCIIVPRLTRWAVWGCDDAEMQVVPE